MSAVLMGHRAWAWAWAWCGIPGRSKQLRTQGEYCPRGELGGAKSGGVWGRLKIEKAVVQVSADCYTGTIERRRGEAWLEGSTCM